METVALVLLLSGDPTPKLVGYYKDMGLCETAKKSISFYLPELAIGRPADASERGAKYAEWMDKQKFRYVCLQGAIIPKEPQGIIRLVSRGFFVISTFLKCNAIAVGWSCGGHPGYAIQ